MDPASAEDDVRWTRQKAPTSCDKAAVPFINAFEDNAFHLNTNPPVGSRVP